MSDWLPNDPNKGVSLSELLKKHGGNFKTVVEKKDWFDPAAKPRKKKSEANFEPEDIKGDIDGNISIQEQKNG